MRAPHGAFEVNEEVRTQEQLALCVSGMRSLGRRTERRHERVERVA
jgi:hypothetical protein